MRLPFRRAKIYLLRDKINVRTAGRAAKVEESNVGLKNNEDGTLKMV